MDINTLRAVFTVVTFATFIAILGWAFSGRRKQAFDEAALLPFTEDDSVPDSDRGQGSVIPFDARQRQGNRGNQGKSS